VVGLLAYFLWNFFFFFIFARILFLGFGGRTNSAFEQAALYWGMCIVLGIFTAMVAFRIPRRLARCAAED
jgi:hypothetical protein